MKASQILLLVLLSSLNCHSQGKWEISISSSFNTIKSMDLEGNTIDEFNTKNNISSLGLAYGIRVSENSRVGPSIKLSLSSTPKSGYLFSDITYNELPYFSVLSGAYASNTIFDSYDDTVLIELGVFAETKIAKFGYTGLEIIYTNSNDFIWSTGKDKINVFSLRPYLKISIFDSYFNSLNIKIGYVYNKLDHKNDFSQTFYFSDPEEQFYFAKPDHTNGILMGLTYSFTKFRLIRPIKVKSQIRLDEITN